MDFQILRICIAMLILAAFTLGFSEPSLLMKSIEMPSSSEYSEIIQYLGSLTFSLVEFNKYAEEWNGIALELHFAGNKHFENLDVPEPLTATYDPRSLAKRKTSVSAIYSKTHTDLVSERARIHVASRSKHSSSQESKRSLKDMAISYTFDCFCKAIHDVKNEGKKSDIKIMLLSFLTLIKRDWMMTRQVISDLHKHDLNILDCIINLTFE